ELIAQKADLRVVGVIVMISNTCGIFARARFVFSLPALADKLPLTLGEGWGEGLADELRDYHFQSLLVLRSSLRCDEKKIKRLSALSPHPTSPKGRGKAANHVPSSRPRISSSRIRNSSSDAP